MTSSVSESLSRLGRATAAIAAAFTRPEEPSHRAERLAAALREFWPAAALAACLLREGNSSEAAVLDSSGLARPDLAGALRAGANGPSLPALLELVGQRLLLEPVVVAGRWHGALAVAAPADGDAVGEPATRAALAACGRHLALHLEVEASQRDLDLLRQRLTEEIALATIGEMAGPVVHEFNNLLNTMLLQVAVMEQKVDESLLPDLRTIRRQGTNITALVKQWQQCRRRPPAAEQPPLDVNRLTEEVVAALRQQRNDLDMGVDLAPGRPRTRGPAADLRRLLTFLLNNALEVSGTGRVVVSTREVEAAVVLRVEDSGPGVLPAALPRLFEPLGEGRPGANRLELAACRTLVRRLQGKLRAENRPTGGVAVIVELPAERV
jgi:signal transduction histidine kinase